MADKGQKQYTHVIWDWNGTLLDDASICMDVINGMLSKRGLPTMKDIHDYHGVFGFPVIDYYRRIGFDFEKEPFEALAAEYVSLYYGDGRQFRLFPCADAVLSQVSDMGLRQVVLSASELTYLRAQIKPFGIERYFDEILGISDIYAKSKADVGRTYARRAEIGSAVLVGDTAHDSEVAKSLGMDCVLIPNGHQGKRALSACGVPVLGDLRDVPDALRNARA
jgi:phosphoglycolate phosphatase